MFQGISLKKRGREREKERKNDMREAKLSKNPITLFSKGAYIP